MTDYAAQINRVLYGIVTLNEAGVAAVLTDDVKHEIDHWGMDTTVHEMILDQVGKLTVGRRWPTFGEAREHVVDGDPNGQRWYDIFEASVIESVRSKGWVTSLPGISYS